MSEGIPDPETDVSVAIVLLDRDSGVMRHVRGGTPEHDAAIEWARFHHLDPMTVPHGSVVLRDAYRFRISYWRYVYDPPQAMPDPRAIVVRDGAAEREWVHEQGEAPPLPFP
jgi:hypothetical protein